MLVAILLSCLSLAGCDDVRVYAGHGPATTVQRERLTNPFFGGGGGYDPFAIR